MLTLIANDIIIIESNKGEQEMQTLSSWIKSEYKAYPSMSPLEIKEDVASTLQCGIATLYRWLKEENVYIECVGASIAGDDNGLIIWKLQKQIFE